MNTKSEYSDYDKLTDRQKMDFLQGQIAWIEEELSKLESIDKYTKPSAANNMNGRKA